MRLEAAARPVFARHESFHPRYGWLTRAVDAAADEGSVFQDEAAVVRLGVGKNMVKAIKHWGLATKVLTEVPNAARPRMPLVAPTSFGRALLGQKGMDRYCEDLATLWALHWRLVAPPSRTPVWWLALSEFPGLSFSQSDLEEFVLERLSRTHEWEQPHPNSVRKDVACFLRMYTSTAAGPRATADDVIDCPFRHLGLVRSDAAGRYRYDLGAKPGLSPRIVLWACLDYMSRTEPKARSVPVSRLAREPGAPGSAFRLSEEALLNLLEEADAPLRVDKRHLVQVVGVAQLRWSGSSAAAGNAALWSHYPRNEQGGTSLTGPLSDQTDDMSELVPA